MLHAEKREGLGLKSWEWPGDEAMRKPKISLIIRVLSNLFIVASLAMHAQMVAKPWQARM